MLSPFLLSFGFGILSVSFEGLAASYQSSPARAATCYRKGAVIGCLMTLHELKSIIHDKKSRPDLERPGSAGYAFDRSTQMPLLQQPACACNDELRITD